jgi:predicted Zn-dependent peptidase
MRSIRLTPENLRNQVDVVKEEIRVNVINQPYGGFPWIELPMVLFETFPNAHNAYGEMSDLEAATLEEAQAFFDRYYAPGNAVLVVAGDLGEDAARALIERHFGDIPPRPVPPTVDASEPLPSRERRLVKRDPLAPTPALAVGWRVPDPLAEVDDYAAAVLLAAILGDGDASRLYQRLVRGDGLATHVGARVGLVCDAFETRDPSMLQVLAFSSGDRTERLLAGIDEEIDAIAAGIDEEEVARFRGALVSDSLAHLDGLMQRALAIAPLEQQRGRPELINEIPALLEGVTAEAVSRVAGQWLRPDRRAVLDWRPGGSR